MTARERPAAMSAGSNAAQAGVMTGAPTACAARGWYHTAANPFRFNWPPVPARQFLDERDRAFDPATPTGIIHLDSSDALGTSYPATTPTLLASYVKICAGERLAGTLISSGEVYYVLAGSGETRNGPDTIAWNEGDVFSIPSGIETVHCAGARDCLLFRATDEPLLAFSGLQAPARGAARIEATHWLHSEIERRLEAVWERPITADTTGASVMFTSAATAPSYATTPTINVAINTLAPGRDQRAHRHNGVAVTLALQGDGIHSMIEDQRIDWSTGAAQITPATLLHSHHNRGDKRMRSLVIQDEGLHYYLRTPGFSFD